MSLDDISLDGYIHQFPLDFLSHDTDSGVPTSISSYVHGVDESSSNRRLLASAFHWCDMS